LPNRIRQTGNAGADLFNTISTPPSHTETGRTYVRHPTRISEALEDFDDVLAGVEDARALVDESLARVGAAVHTGEEDRRRCQGGASEGDEGDDAELHVGLSYGFEAIG
jgi:hypothetical protein